MPENRIVWKSNNQGAEEETFIQTGRKGGDGQPGWRGLEARRLADQMVPHLRVDKPGGTTEDRDRLCSPGFQHGEIKPQKPLGVVAAGENSQPHR